MEQQILDIQTKIAEVVAAVPGVLGFSTSNVDKKHTVLSPSKATNGIKCTKVKKAFNIQLFIVISKDIVAKTIVEEAFSSIKNVFKDLDMELGQVFIYIRGVK